jgi:hypothetical protein
MSTEAKFYEVSEETQNKFLSIVKTKYGLDEIAFQFIGKKSQKCMVKITKIPDQYEFLLKKHVIVSINEEILETYEDEESIKILFEQEIERLSYEFEKSKVKLIKTNINTFSSLIQKYGMEKISRANQLEELVMDSMQQTDFENNFIS